VGQCSGRRYASFIQMVTIAASSPLTTPSSTLPRRVAAGTFLSGSVDIMIAGIPQRLACSQGRLCDAYGPDCGAEHGSTCGFGTTRGLGRCQMELAVRLEGDSETLDYVEKNPDEAFPIISEKLGEQGTRSIPRL